MLEMHDLDNKIINLNNVTYIENGDKNLTVHFIDGSSTICRYSNKEIVKEDLNLLRECQL